MAENGNKGQFQPGDARAGRPKGVPNKATTAVREAIAAFAEANVGKLQGWLEATARRNPEKAADLFLRAIEYHIPKLGRTELTGKDGESLLPGLIVIPRKEIQDQGGRDGATNPVVATPEAG